MLNFEIYKENAEERLSYTSSDTPRTFIRALEDIVKLCKYGQKLEIEYQALREDIKCLKQSLEWRDNVIANLRNQLQGTEKTLKINAVYFILQSHLERAREKYPDFEGLICVLREVADLIKADETGTREDVQKQALHVAVTALRLYEGD